MSDAKTLDAHDNCGQNYPTNETLEGTPVPRRAAHLIECVVLCLCQSRDFADVNAHRVRCAPKTSFDAKLCVVIDFGFAVFRTFQHRSSATTIAVHFDMPEYEKNKLILALRELNLTADAVGTPSGKFGSYMRNQQSRFR